MDTKWKKRLELLPQWTQAGLSQFEKKCDYIAYRLAQQVDIFNTTIKNEIEEKLAGVTGINTEYSLDANEQRAFFIANTVRIADYYRPTSEATIKQIPTKLNPKTRPSIIDDVNQESILRSQIIDTAHSLACLLRQHHVITERLELRNLECDIFQMIWSFCITSEKSDYIEGIEDEFEKLMFLKGIDTQSPHSLSLLIDQLHIIAKESDRSLIPLDVRLGITSRKGDNYFFEALSAFISSNSIDDFGFLPNNLHFSDACWSGLVSCFTYKDISPKAIQMYRSRSSAYIDKSFERHPRFVLDPTGESWFRFKYK